MKSNSNNRLKNTLSKGFAGLIQSCMALTLCLVGTHAAAQSTYTFNYTGSQQTLALTPGSYDIKAWGGDGYTQTAGYNGRGGYANGILTLTSAQTIYIYVGGVGSYPSGGVSGNTWTFNGGGIGYPAANNLYGNGGGASDVRTVGGTWDNATSLASRVIVAGGGGAGRNASYIGGNGGGLVGGTGTYFSPDQTGGPTGGSQTAGGSNTGYTSGLTTATLGMAMTWNGSALTANFLAGGGGGYYGGGSGRVAGGGGSSYLGGVSSGTTIMFGASNFTASPVATSGNGFVIITELCNITLNNNLTGNNNVNICAGTSLSLTTNAISNYSWSTGSSASSIVVTPTATTIYTLSATSPSNCVASRVMTVTVNSGSPTLSINTGTNVICAGQTLSFTASGANTYTWSNGIINGSTFSPTATAGYTVLGQNGCGTSSAVTTITVAPLPVSLISSPTVVCAGSTSTLSAAAAATSYTWFPVSTNAASIVVSPIANSVYTVVVSNGTCLGAATVAVNANPVPTIVASPTLASICAGDQLVMTATGANSYTWTPGNLSGNSVTVSPNVPTPYQVAGTNSFGCSSAANLAVIVMPSPSLSVLTDANLICAGSVVNMTVSGANSYTWNGGTTSNTISVNPNNTTSYTVTGEVSGCLSNTVINISVVNPSVSIAGNTSICAGESSTLTASGATSYSWNTGAIGSNAVVTPSGTSIYTVFASTNSISVNCPSTKTISVNVKPLPVVVASVSNSNICKGDNCVLSASGAGTYTWNTGATNASITVNHTLLTTVIYTVTGTSTLNCNNTATVQLKVNSCLGLNHENSLRDRVQIYPNPNNGDFTIICGMAMDVVIFNQLGEVIKSFETTANRNFKIDGLKGGVYYVVLRSGEEKLSVKLLVNP